VRGFTGWPGWGREDPPAFDPELPGYFPFPYLNLVMAPQQPHDLVGQADCPTSGTRFRVGRLGS
jgi:hypothetical protein